MSDAGDEPRFAKPWVGYDLRVVAFHVYTQRVKDPAPNPFNVVTPAAALYTWYILPS